ncbi:MAG TPA: phasin family protein [Rhodanobacteraceae bacterium]|nr:phasin family protein [Rhodanobacteraceae bacterium]
MNMYAQLQQQTLNLGKQWAEQSYKAQLTALRGFAEIQGLQVKALEAQVKANLAFVADSLEAREIEDVSALWPKGLDFARNSAEAAYEAGQQALGVAQKTAEQLGELARNGVKAANDAAGNTAKKAAR